MKVGFIGLGQMGSGMAARLLEAGHALTVYNRTRARTKPLQERGASVADTPALACSGAEAVFTILSVYHQCAPATANYRDVDPEIDLDIVAGAARPMEIRYALSDNIGLGGHNGAVIFKRYDGD